MSNTNANTNGPRTIIKDGYEIEITKECKVDVLEGISKRTNNPFKIVKQEAWLHTDGVAYPHAVRFNCMIRVKHVLRIIRMQLVFIT